MSHTRLATKRTLIICAIGLAVTVGAGAAIAATTKVFDPKEEQEAFQAAVAEKLGVTTAELEDAYKEAALERLDAAVAAGRITESEAAAIRERIEAGDFLGPHGFGFGFGFHVERGPGHHLAAATDYLDLTEAQLRERLLDGESLAEIAEAEGKSVSGLKQAMLADAKAKLDEAVHEGRITSAERDELLARLQSMIDDLGNRSGPPELGPRFGHRFGGPMDSAFAPPDA